MKALSKLGLLLALIVAGRFLRPTEPAAPNQQPTAARVVKANTLHFASYTTIQGNPVANPAATLNTVANPHNEPAYLVWY